MKIHIKLNKRKQKQTAEGSPIVVYVTQNYKEREWATGYFSQEKHWNTQLSIPTRKHPKYYLLLDYLQILKDRIIKVHRKNEQSRLTLDEIKKLIFNKEYSIFYEAVIAIIGKNAFDDTRYSAINAFNDRYNGYSFQEINRQMVSKWIKERLIEGKKPSGVDSYVRSLRKLWNDLSDLENPFRSHKIEIPEKIQPVSTSEDLQKLANAKLKSRKNSISGPEHYRNYWLLMFYLGGIDPEVLIKLRYDEHVHNNRINFNRNKGQSKTACSNLIPDQAWVILKQYNCKPYLVPIYQSKNTKEFIKNMSARINEYLKGLELSVRIRSKSARHTFINLAQQKLVDERITAQIVGHKRKTTTSLYSNDFPKEVQDEAHLRIINLEKQRY